MQRERKLRNDIYENLVENKTLFMHSFKSKNLSYKKNETNKNNIYKRKTKFIHSFKKPNKSTTKNDQKEIIII